MGKHLKALKYEAAEREEKMASVVAGPGAFREGATSQYLPLFGVQRRPEPFRRTIGGKHGGREARRWPNQPQIPPGLRGKPIEKATTDSINAWKLASKRVGDTIAKVHKTNPVFHSELLGDPYSLDYFDEARKTGRPGPAAREMNKAHVELLRRRDAATLNMISGKTVKWTKERAKKLNVWRLGLSEENREKKKQLYAPLVQGARFS